MTENTIQQLEQIRETADDDFERRFFSAILALDAAATASETRTDEPEPGEMARCAQCDDLWPAEDLYSDGFCPNCVICRHYAARQWREENRRIVDGQDEISDADPGL
jgi:hypothetical protein